MSVARGGLAGSTSGARSLAGRGAAGTIGGCASSAAEVLVGELVSETDIGVVAARSVGPRLVTGVVVAVALGRVLALLLVVHEVALGSIAGLVGLLLLLWVLHALLLLLLLGLAWEDGLRKGRGSRRILAVATGSQTIVVVPNVEIEAVIIAVHSCRFRLDSGGLRGVRVGVGWLASRQRGRGRGRGQAVLCGD